MSHPHHLSSPSSPSLFFSDRLSAQDLLTIHKVQEYVYDKLYGEKGEDAGKEGRGSNIDILCAEQVRSSNQLTTSCMGVVWVLHLLYGLLQVLDPELDLRTVKYSVWRSGGDMKLFYREDKSSNSKTKQPPLAESVGKGERDTAMTTGDHTPPDGKEE